MNAFNAPVCDYLPLVYHVYTNKLKIKDKADTSLHHTLIFIKIQLQKDAVKIYHQKYNIKGGCQNISSEIQYKGRLSKYIIRNII